MSLLGCSKIALTVSLLLLVRCQTGESATVTDLLSAMLNTLKNIESLMTYESAAVPAVLKSKNPEAAIKKIQRRYLSDVLQQSVNSNVNRNTNVNSEGTRRAIINNNKSNNQNALIAGNGGAKGGINQNIDDEEKVKPGIVENESADDEQTGNDNSSGGGSGESNGKGKLWDLEPEENSNARPSPSPSPVPSRPVVRPGRPATRVPRPNTGNLNYNDNENVNKNLNVNRNVLEAKRVEGSRRANSNFNKNVNIQLAEETSAEGEDEVEDDRPSIKRRANSPPNDEDDDRI